MTCKNHRDLIHGVEFSLWELWSSNRRVCLECWEDQGGQKPEIDGTEFGLAKTQQPQVDGMEMLFWLKPNDLKCMEWTLT